MRPCYREKENVSTLQGRRHTWAMKSTEAASYKAAPSRLMLVPRGMTNLTMLGRHLRFTPHSMVTGMVAAEEEVPNPMAKAGK